jgi:hypothetical protein
VTEAVVMKPWRGGRIAAILEVKDLGDVVYYSG